MKQIKRGDTTAVTRDGREVTQLKWFDVEGEDTLCVEGVVEGEIRTWYEDGGFFRKGYTYSSNLDIFAKPEYEYQWIYKRKEDTHWKITTGYYKTMVTAEYISLPVIETEREVKD